MPRQTDLRRVLVIGSGPIVIGQACEFDYSGTQACKALRAEGLEVVLVNSNPATIMTDPEVADRTYIEPLTPEFVAAVIERERPDALLPTVGGQTALNLAVALSDAGTLERYGVRLIGASVEAIRVAEDRLRFREAMREIGMDVPRSAYVGSLAEAQAAIDELGFPVIVRPSFTLGGTGGGIAYNVEEFREVVERGLVHRAAEALLSGAADWTLDRELLESRYVEPAPSPPPPSAPIQPTQPALPALIDDAALCLAELRSGQADRVRRALQAQRPLDPVLVPAVIDLLAWNAIYAAARETLLSIRSPIAGQLGDRLADPRCDVAIRRRIPSLLLAIGGRRAMEALLVGLADERFEVRFRSARALDELVCRQPELAPPADVIYDAIERELSVDRNIWRSRRLLGDQPPLEQIPHLDEILRERADRSLEHLFSLLALVLPREPLKAAFRSLHADDDALRALALEYLDGVLPRSLGSRLREILEQPPAAGPLDAARAVDELLRSHASIELSLRRRLEAEQTQPRSSSGTLSPDT